MYSLFNKVAIITGGASGIGKASALLLSKAEASIVIADVDDQGGQAVADIIVKNGGKAIYMHCDVTSASDCQLAVASAIGEFGSVDILFNNAGIIRRTTVLNTTEVEWDHVMAVNVKSIFLLSKFAIPHMEKSGGGVIINTSSGWGMVGGKNAVSYCASKGAVVNMTRAMALDHGSQNIRVNCICPGDTDTPMLRNEARQLDQTDEEFLADAADRPLKRIGTPDDIANTVLYLASDASSFITGTTIIVDGGGLAG
ncbi:MAG: glucose 1-dehydrogenase [Anaerolineales bacterium]|nr:glucose 1-dehydrogenase [Anaerolineales bacterium]